MTPRIYAGSMRDVLLPDVVIWRPVVINPVNGSRLGEDPFRRSDKGGWVARVIQANLTWEPGLVGISYRHGGPVVVVREELPEDWTYLVVTQNRLKADERGGVLFAAPGEVEFPAQAYVRWRSAYYSRSRDHLNDPLADRVRIAEAMPTPPDARYLRAVYQHRWKGGGVEYAHFAGLSEGSKQ